MIRYLGLLAMLLILHLAEAKAQEFMQITTIESVVPGGLGRSRMVTVDENGKMRDEKMKNFFSMVGINFGNIRENDQQITNKISELTQEGWELIHVTPGVYGGAEGAGIFITRYLFRRDTE